MPSRVALEVVADILRQQRRRVEMPTLLAHDILAALEAANLKIVPNDEGRGDD